VATARWTKLEDRLEHSRVWHIAVEHYRLRRRPAVVNHRGISIAVDPTWGPLITDGIYRDEYERQELQVLRQTLRPDDRYFEIGAAIGVVATAACQIVGDQNVIAYEANPALLPLARETTARNGFHPEIINSVLGDQTDGTVDFYVNDIYLSSSLTPQPNARKISVPIRRFADELGRFRPSYLMLDIEGAEVELLAPRLPEYIQRVCVEVHPGVVGIEIVNELVLSIVSQGLLLQTSVCVGDVLFFARKGQEVSLQ
jgi:FkbM family methyltransferase